MILVTGATGFLGRNVVQALAQRSKEIVCLVRETSDITALPLDRVSLRLGDLRKPETLREALDGVSTVVHMAAVLFSNNEEDFITVNQVGTEQLVELCCQRNVERFVFVSTVNATLRHKDTYGHSKARAEDIVRQRLPQAVILRPSMIYGPGDRKNLHTLILRVKQGRVIPILGDGNYRHQPVHVSDVASVVVKALEKESAKGESYHVAGPDPVTYNELYDLIARGLSKKVIKIHIPVPIAIAGCLLLRKVGRKVPTRDQILQTISDKTVDISKTIKDFDYAPIPINNGVLDLLALYK